MRQQRLQGRIHRHLGQGLAHDDRHGLVGSDEDQLRAWLRRGAQGRCRQLRRHGRGPAATAASNNPALSTLVAAVKAAGLVDTLNGPGPFTIFAPTNDAFAKIDKATLDQLLADPKGALTKILTYHVIAGQKLNAQQLADAGIGEDGQGRHA